MKFLLALSFFLKKAYLLCGISLISIIPTWTFKGICKDTFEQSYNDAALLQTSELDGWKVGEEMPYMERERYRRWVVDCHKASYVPVCVNAEDDYLTSEPAVVIPTQQEMEMDNQSTTNGMDLHDSRDQSSSSAQQFNRARTSTIDSFNSFVSQRNQSQRGAIFRRVANSPMNFTQNGDNSSILDECESYKGQKIFPGKIIETSSEAAMSEESRDKLL